VAPVGALNQGLGRDPNESLKLFGEEARKMRD